MIGDGYRAGSAIKRVFQHLLMLIPMYISTSSYVEMAERPIIGLAQICRYHALAPPELNFNAKAVRSI